MSEILGEARVVIRPDTTQFRAVLEAEIASVTKKPVVIPVTAAVAGTAGGATASLRQELAGATAAQAAASATTKQATTANIAYARSVEAATAVTARLAGVEEAMSLTTTELAASRARLRVVTAAVGDAEKAFAAAVATGNPAVVAAQANVTRLVLATRALAVADTQAAVAQAELNATTSASARNLGQVQTAAIAGGAGMAGLRGAVLTAGGAFIAATVAIQSFGKAIQSAAQFETELNVFRVTAGATADEMERVADTARALGTDISLPGVAANDAAEAMNQLAKAGLSVQDSLDGARGVLQLATAAQIDNIEATNLVASALNAFSLSGEQAVTVADLLTGAANEAQGSIGDMGLALQQSAAVAKLAGINVQDTVTLITELAQAGLRGSDAGTSLRVALIRLINPTKVARAELKELNVQIRDASGNIRPEVFADLAVALREMTQAQRDATLATIFGQDALRAAAILGSAGVSGFRDTRDAITEQGLASEQAAARTQGLAGAGENLKNQLAGLGLTVGNLVKGPLKFLADGIALDVQFLNFLATGVEDLSERLRDNAVVDFAAKVVDTTQDVGGFFDRITEGIPALDGFFEPLEKAGDAAAEEAAELRENLAPALKEVTANTEGYSVSLSDAAGRSQELISVTGILATAMADAATRATLAAGGIRDSFEGLSAEQILGRIRGLDEKEVLARLGGDTDAILAALQARREELQKRLGGVQAQRQPGLRRNLQNQLLATINEIAAIEESQAADAERAANDLAQARDERDQAILDTITGRERQLLNNQIRAQGTEGEKDDIEAAVALRNFYRRAVQRVRETVGDAKVAAQAISALISDQIKAEQEITSSQKALAEARKEAAQERRQAAREAREAAITGTELDIELAEIQENEGREIALRRRLIKQLQDRIRHEKGNTNLIKELRNEIARQRAEIAKTETEAKRGKSPQQFFFEQLQAQQGFAANLMGNLIPSDQTAGLVGVPSPNVGRQVSAEAARAEGKAFIGPTAGQSNTEISLLGRILDELKSLNRHSDAPEAKEQRRAGSADMDGSGGAGGGVSAVM